MEEWGVDQELKDRGGLAQPQIAPPARQVYLLQRSKGKMGERLGKTTGWIHRSTLKQKKVEMISGVEYLRVDDQGLHLLIGGKPTVLAVDNVVICAGQEPLRALQAPLEAQGVTVHLIGGADEARELDAKRAIDQATRLGVRV
jgi:2,4-dienoyl-CoA reductase (NADPH2)